ncbi:MAG: cupin domain-containing protein [Acidobacteria bacterium]|nr:cupin domain-containing protein [Acidobacteriota bacterium]MCB9397322.1 cupin domain-containing protein [Acidobacteriota bacterium]
MNEKTNPPAAGLMDSAKPENMLGNISKIFRAMETGRWRYIDEEAYKKDTESYRGMTRRELIGKRGESTQFHLRYFEIEPGGYSTYEQHHHEHAVVVTRGSGEVRIGCRYLPAHCGDIIYVAPDDAHQFLNPDTNTEPFGFLCIVNAERDRPRAADGEAFCAICE